MRHRVLKLSVVVSCMFLVLYTNPVFSQKLGNISEKKVISFELRDEPLKLVAKEIFKQTGYKVVFDEKWNDLPLRGQYTGVTIGEFFERALHKQNVTLSYDEKSRVVKLRFFGDRGFGKGKAGILESGKDSSAQVSEDIKELHEQQRQELKEYLKDPEAVDPVNGMKLVDIQELHSIQQAELEQLRSDPKAIDPLSGMTNGEIKKLHDVQHAETEQLQNDPKAVDPVSGMANAEIKKLHDVQNAEMEQLRNDPKAVDPVSGMAIAEIKRLHDVQQAEFEQLKKNPENRSAVQIEPREDKGGVVP